MIAYVSPADSSTGISFVAYSRVESASVTGLPPQRGIVAQVIKRPFDRDFDLTTTTGEAREFIRSNGLQQYIEFARIQIAELFEVSGIGTVEKKEDPEFPDEWVTISIRVFGETETIVDAYDEFTRRWVRKIPRSVTRKIRLSLGAA